MQTRYSQLRPTARANAMVPSQLPTLAAFSGSAAGAATAACHARPVPAVSLHHITCRACGATTAAWAGRTTRRTCGAATHALASACAMPATVTAQPTAARLGLKRWFGGSATGGPAGGWTYRPAVRHVLYSRLPYMLTELPSASANQHGQPSPHASSAAQVQVAGAGAA